MNHEYQQLVINFYEDYWTNCRTIQELCERHNVSPEKANQYINEGRELTNIERRAS